MIAAVMKSMDHALEGGIADHWGSRLRTMLRIKPLPLVIPGVLGAAIFVLPEKMLGSFCRPPSCSGTHKPAIMFIPGDSNQAGEAISAEDPGCPPPWRVVFAGDCSSCCSCTAHS